MMKLLFLLLAMLLAACSSSAERRPPLGQKNFAQYLQETRQWLLHNRAFQSGDKVAELSWNLPQEWRPAGQPTRAILLVHGLGDSPWSFSDIGPELARQGFLVRSVLLPGHGTQPLDLAEQELADWQRLVREQTQILQREVPQVYMGGFSTGANLVTDYALANPDIAGLLLFSPAFKSNSDYDWLTPLIAPFSTWLREPDGSRPQQSPVRYLNTPTNGFAMFYRSSQAVRSNLERRPYDKPVVIMTVQHDSVLDVNYTLQLFARQFTHPASRLIWYGDTPSADLLSPRVLVRSDRLPEQRISQFSHMGILFSPRNLLYGDKGSLRLCWNGQDAAAIAQCQAGEPVWYSDWGYREVGKVHARLTFNPYFDWQSGIIQSVLWQESREKPLSNLSLRPD